MSIRFLTMLCCFLFLFCRAVDFFIAQFYSVFQIVPPIRRSGKRQQPSSSKRETKVKFKDEKRPIQKQRISSYDYDAWSKFDVVC